MEAALSASEIEPFFPPLTDLCHLITNGQCHAHAMNIEYSETPKETRAGDSGVYVVAGGLVGATRSLYV